MMANRCHALTKIGVVSTAALGLFFLSFVSGCAQRTSMPMQHDVAQSQLEEAALAVSQSITRLAEVEQAAKTPKHFPAPPDPASYGMGQPITVDWTGPLEPIVRRLAESSHYQVKVLGKVPAIPVIVTVLAVEQPVGDVLRNVGFQGKDKADVVIYPKDRLIEIRYGQT